MNLAIRSRGLALATRLRPWSEHLELDESDVAGDPAQIVDEVWQPHARERLERLHAGAPLTHRLLALPHVPRRINALRGPVDSLVVDG